MAETPAPVEASAPKPEREDNAIVGTVAAAKRALSAVPGNTGISGI